MQERVLAVLKRDIFRHDPNLICSSITKVPTNMDASNSHSLYLVSYTHGFITMKRHPFHSENKFLEIYAHTHTHTRAYLLKRNF